MNGRSLFISIVTNEPEAMYNKIFLLLFIAGIQQVHAQNPNVFESLNDTSMVKAEGTHSNAHPP